MEHDISLDFLWRIFKKSWWKILIIAVAALLLVAAFTHFFIPKKYSSSIKFYVVNTNTSYDYTTSSLLSASAYLINDYVSIIKSDYMLNQVRESLVAQGYEESAITNNLLRSMIQSSTEADTSVFDLIVVHTNKRFAYDVASTIAELAPTAITDLAKADSLTHESLADKVYTIIDYYNKNQAPDDSQKVNLTEKEIVELLKNGFTGIATRQDCIEVITPPVEDTVQDSPDLVTYSLLGAIVAAVVAYLIFLARHLFELNIASEDDIKKMINRPLIGTVPHWEISTRK